MCSALWPRDVRAVANIDLGAIERNCRRLPTPLCAVVKANAYGHGTVPVAEAALRGGAEWLAVATAAEVAELRAAGIEGSVLVMGALTSGELRTAIDAEADVVAWTEEVADAAPRVHVKLDTGMSRLGTKELELARRLAARPNVVGLMTHFATADEDDPAFLDAQLEQFERWIARHPGVPVHAANSAATLRKPAARFDLVRCGIAIYGMDPFHRDPSDHGLEPALELVSYVAEVKRAAPGQSVGYGRRFVAERETWIGTLPIGYGDGVRRGLTNNADVLVDGRRVPLVGTVSMDNITVDLGDEPVRHGAEAVLIGARGGERILAEDLGRRLGTINYEITCGISPRVPREHV
jgi:alanine racemase